MINKLNLPAESILAQIPYAIIWKDLSLKFCGSSLYIANNFGFNTIDSMVGIDAYGIRCPAVECADQFIKQDRSVLRTKKSLKTLDVHPFSGGNIKVLLGSRVPLFNSESELVGTMYQGVEITNKDIADIGIRLSKHDEKLGKTRALRSYNFSSNQPFLDLTPRESETLFFILRGKTVKEVAKVLKLSPRTIETYLENLKNKFACKNKSELIDHAINLGYLSVIPDSLLESNLSVIL